MNSFLRALAAAALAIGMAITGAPAHAQTPAPDPTVYQFALPGTVKAGATKFRLPGDLTTRKSRGGEELGSMPLTEVVTEVTRLKKKGHSVGGTVTISGRTREMKGIPEVLADGSVRVRVAQARGTRAVMYRGRGGSSSVVTCVPGYYTMYNADGSVTCIPYTE